MLTPGALARLRRDLRSTLTEAATILRPTPALAADGGETVAWAPVATGVPCRVSWSAGGGERALPDRTAEVIRAVVRLPVGADVTMRDRLVVLGTAFEVIEVRAPRSSATATVVVASVVG